MLRFTCLGLLLGAMVACSPTTATPSPTAAPQAASTQPAAPAKPQATSITTVTTAQTGAYGPFWTAVEAGYFADEGLDLHLTTVDSTSRGIAVLLSGEAQFCTLDGQTVIEADTKGADLRSIAAITNRLVFSVMVDPSIKAAADLKGKRVGITTAGSSTDTAARQALSILKIDPSDVALVPLASAPNILTGMTAKQVDAGVLSPPTNTRARNAGFQELLSLAKDGPDYPSVTLGSTQKYLSSNPEVALAFVRAYARGIHRFKTDEAFATQAIGKYLQLNDQAVLDDTWKQFSPLFADVPYVNPQGVQNAIDTVAQTTTPEAAGTTPDRYVDSSFVKQLEDSGFFKQLSGS
jgi:NitT/TauT family transport system substrate-binding protein